MPHTQVNRFYIRTLPLVAVIGVFFGLMLPFDNRPVYQCDTSIDLFPPAVVHSNIDKRLTKFAGKYFRRQGHSGSRLCILQDGRFSAFTGDCLGGGTWKSGYASIVEGELVLEPSSGRKKRPHFNSLTFTPLLMGARQYLIESERMPQFKRDVSEGQEPRSEAGGDYYLRDGDWKKATND